MVSMDVIFIWQLAHSYNTSYSQRYGERANPGFDFLDADSSARIRARLGGDETGRRHPCATGARHAESAGACGLARYSTTAPSHVAVRRIFLRLGKRPEYESSPTALGMERDGTGGDGRPAPQVYFRT